MYIQINTNIYERENVMTDKDGTMNFRVEASLKHDFMNMCEERGVVSSKVMRKLIIDELRKYDQWLNEQKAGKKNGR